MILTAGAALALAASVHLFGLVAGTSGRLWGELVSHRRDLPYQWRSFRDATREPLRNTLWYGYQVAEASLFGMTPTFFILRLRRPRPPFRVLLAQPGMVAGLAMVFGLFWGTGTLLTLFPGRFDGFSAAPSAIGGAVALAWFALALSRKGKPEPGWVDRMGRILGFVAIGLAVLLPAIMRI